jgi:hypothetical protein
MREVTYIRTCFIKKRKGNQYKVEAMCRGENAEREEGRMRVMT